MLKVLIQNSDEDVMPYEVSNGAQEGFLSGVQSADRRNQAQLEDYARTRNDFFTLLGDRIKAVASAPNEYRVNLINQLADKGNDAFLHQMNTDSEGRNYFRSNGLNNQFISPKFAQQAAARQIAEQMPDNTTWQTIQNSSPDTPISYAINGVQYNVPAGQLQQRFGTIFANKQYADNALALQNQLFNRIPALTQSIQQYEYDIATRRPPSISQADYEKYRRELDQANAMAAAYERHASTIPNAPYRTGGLFGQQPNK